MAADLGHKGFLPRHGRKPAGQNTPAHVRQGAADGRQEMDARGRGQFLLGPPQEQINLGYGP